MNNFDEEGLKKIDKVSNLMNKLMNDSDDNSTIHEIDEYLSNSIKESKGFDKTLINKSNNSVHADQNAFLKEIERDAKERYERKAKAREKADAIKIKANQYFKANDFETSIKYYTKAIEECIDYEILYTNRAQAYLKIDKVNEAFTDCNMALKINENNHKAILHKGRCLTRLNRYDDAINCYQEVVRLVPSLENYVREYIDNAEKMKLSSVIIRDSADAFDISVQSTQNDVLNEIIEKLVSKTDDNIEFYVGGLELILSTLNDQENNLECLRSDLVHNRKLFDNKSEIIKRIKSICLKKTSKISEIEKILFSLWMQLLRKISKNDEACIIRLLNDQFTVSCIDFCCKSAQTIQFSCLSSVIFLLYHMSNIDIGTQQIVDKFAVQNILSITLEAMKADQKNELVTVALALFHNLVQSQRLKAALGKEEELVSAVIDCLHVIFAASVSHKVEELPTVISIVELLSDNSTIRVRLLKHDKFLDDLMKTIEARLTIHDDEKHSSVLLQLFTLIHNLLVRSKNNPTGDKVKSLYNRIITAASQLLSNHPIAEVRSILIQVLSQMLSVFPEDKLKTWCEYQQTNTTVESEDVSLCRSLSRQSSLTDIGYLDKVCKPLKLCITILDAQNHPLLPNAIKILTLASKVNEPVRFLCCDVRERVLKLRSLLYCEKEKLDEVLSGNICLLFIQCVSETPLAEHLLNTGIIKDLLRICADATKNDCRRNAAILAGNLAQSNHIHRAELSKLNGFSIISKFNNWS